MRKDIFNLGLILIIVSVVALFVSTLTRKVGFSSPSIGQLIIFILCLVGLSSGIILSIVSFFLKLKQ